MQIFNTSSLPIMRLLQKNIVVHNRRKHTVRTLDIAASGTYIAGLERKSDAQLYLKTKYVGPDGFPLLHIVKECPTSYFVAYIVPKRSPFLPHFNYLLQLFIESGLTVKWTRDAMFSVIIQSHYGRVVEDHKLKPFSVDDMQSGFVVLFYGYFISFICFLVEKCVSSRKIVRNEMLD